MRKLLPSVLVVPLLLLLLGSAASGSPKSQQPLTKFFFDGTTTQGLEDFFIIEKNSSNPACSTATLCFEPFFATTQISCPDGTSYPFEWLFLNYFVPVVQGQFEVGITSDQIPFDWKGTLSGKNASGTQNQGYAHYASTGGVEDCDVGDVNWRATGVGSGPGAPQGHGIQATVQRDSNGKVKITLTRN